MAGQKFLNLASGQMQEVISTQVGGSGKENLIPALDSTGRLAITMMPVGIAPEVVVYKAKEQIVAGNFVNLVLDTTLKVQKADNSNGRKADGFALTGGEIGDDITVYLEGNNTGVTGMTVGAVQYLSTAGARTETPPTANGSIVQEIGKAISATEMIFDPKSTITVAA